MPPNSQIPRRSGPRLRIRTTQKHREHGPLLQGCKQHGFGLVAAMFLIIIIAGAIAAMWRISATQTATSSLALQQTRAYQAARAGLEWGIYQFVNNASCTTPESDPIRLDGFTIKVECPSGPEWSITHDDLSEEIKPNINIQKIVATAEYSVPGSPDYTYRKLVVDVER